LQYSVNEGYAPLREWLVGRMKSLGVDCTLDNILITSGSQQALDFLGKLFLSKDDTALVGWPTYLGAISAFNANEPVFDKFDIHANRTLASYKDKARTAGGAVKFAYMSVDFANPTSATLSKYERERTLDFAADMDIAIIEDAAYQGLRYDGADIPPILALELERNPDINAARTIYCGSFSKTLAPGLRVGWVCGAASVISKLVLMKQAADLHSSTINQIVTADVVADEFEAHIDVLRATYQSRRDVMLTALEENMPDGVSWSRPEGGMFIWMDLPDYMDGADLLATSLKSHKVAFVPGGAFFPDGSGQNHIRLSFSISTPDEIRDGIGRLGQLIKSAMSERLQKTAQRA